MSSKYKGDETSIYQLKIWQIVLLPLISNSLCDSFSQYDSTFSSLNIFFLLLMPQCEGSINRGTT